MPFVIKTLPKNLDALKSAIDGKSEAWVRIYLKRAVDYHSPLATGTLKKNEVDTYNNFAMNLYQYWLQTDSNLKRVCKLQLQEMLSQSLALVTKAEKHKFETLFDCFIKH